MVMTTTLSDYELDVPTSDKDLNELLQEVKQATGCNYQVVETTFIKERFLRAPIIESNFRLYVEVPGVFPWQMFSCANTAREIKAFLYGVINGIDHGKS